MNSLDAFAAAKMAAIRARNLARSLSPIERGSKAAIGLRGQRMISFSCNDYLGLTHHPNVVAAAIAATQAFGAGAGASRFITGNNPIYDELESELARLKQTEAAVVFGSGYLANIGIVPALAGPADLILGDELMHACLHAGARLSRSNVHLFRHNDINHCRAQLAAHRGRHRHVLILTEGVFSMDGDRAPVAELQSLADEYDAWLLVDDAHAFGVINQGLGSCVDAGGRPLGVPLQMGTLSKAVGAYGGYLCASERVAELIRHRGRSAIFSTALPPGVLAAALAAVKLIAADAGLVARPLALARRFASELGLTPATSAIVPLILGPEERALAASAELARSGFFVSAIRPPTVAEGTSRLRFTFSAAHHDDDVTRLIEAVRRIGIQPRTVAAAR
jgi:8-amino-7-oxononanoate synthase